MAEHQKHIAFGGRLVMVGFGSIGQGVLPLLLRHIDMAAAQIVIVTADEDGIEEARAYGVQHRVLPLTRENYQNVLAALLSPGDFLLNLSVNVGSVDLVRFCQESGVLYLDTCIEPWQGGYTDTSLSSSSRSNYALRETVRGFRSTNGPTALVTHGANPGLVSHLVKTALLDIARDCHLATSIPRTRADWALLAQQLSVKVIHIAERDWQVAEPRKRPNEFLNTWSVDGFVGESVQPAELGWGSHERHFPAQGQRHGFGCDAAIFLDRPGAATRVRSWTPLAGPMQGFLITHGESISIADYFTVGQGPHPDYRPTVHYAYHPSDDTVLSVYEFIGRNWRLQHKKRVVKNEIVGGIDELGVLLMGHPKGACWHGSRLSTEEARKLAPYNSATSLQVTAPVMAGVVWAMRNPNLSVLDPDELPYDEILILCRPYLGELVTVYSDWTPLKDRNALYPEEIDPADPWQFENFLVGC